MPETIGERLKYPKDGQVEKAFIVDGFELIAGNENSSNGKWTYLFARLHSS